MGNKLSDKMLLDALRNLAKKLGRTPTTCDMDTYHRETGEGAGHSSYFDHFGSWADALRVAGLGTPRFARYYSDEDLCELLREYAKKLEHTPLRKEVDANRKSMPCSQTYIQRFGSWKKAIMTAGLESNRLHCSGLSDEDLIVCVQRLAEELGRVPTMYDLELVDWAPCYATYRKRFGGWGKVLNLAGISKPQPKYTMEKHRISKEMEREFKRTKILGQLKRFVNIYKHIPSPDKLGKKTDTPCYRTCVAYFGSWQATLDALANII